MIMNDIHVLAQDRPIQTMEIFEPNDFYGHATILKKYINLPNSYQIKGAIEHGAGIGGDIWGRNIDNVLPAVITTSRYRAEILKEHTSKKIFAIGPKIQYAHHFLERKAIENEKKRLGKNLLAFPAHSTHHVDIHYDIQQYCQYLQNLGKSFDTIRVCLYWKDILRGFAEKYKHHGYEIVTAGHIYDPWFLSRLRSLIETATFTTSNEIGTILGYCVVLNKPHLLMESDIRRSAERIDMLQECSQLSNQKDVVEIRDAFIELRTDLTMQQKNIVRRYWGIDEFKSISELKSIIEETESLYQKGSSIYISKAKMHENKYLFEGTLDKILNDISKVIKTYPRRKNGALKINNRTFFFTDLHSFYYQSIQIFKNKRYGFKPDVTNPIILDCGAQIGLASIFFSEKYPNAEIYAYEADPEISLMLDHNVKSLGLKNVKTFSKAKWIDEERVSFKKSADDCGYINGINEENGIKIPSFSIRNFLNENHVDLLKLDLEGAEFDVIKDCDGVLRNAKNIIIEVHKFHENCGSLGSILRILEKNSFEYTLGDLHSADWIESTYVPPFAAMQSDKFIVTVFAWRKSACKKTLQNHNKLYHRSNSSTTNNYRVVHLCTQDFGGAGKAAYRLHKGLKTIGVNSTMLVLSKRSGDSTVKLFPDDYSKRMAGCLDVQVYNSPLWNQQNRRWQKLMSEYTERPAGLEMFTDAVSDVRLDRIREIREADIINLHWVAGTVDWPSASLGIGDKPIIWTLHDMNPFTGGCHYAGDCKKYMKGCGACPQLGTDAHDDLSHKVWEQKYKAYQDLNINVVTPSRWLGKCASESELFSLFPVQVIPYGLPLDTFRPYPKAEIHKALKVSDSVKIILFGADSVLNERKGFRYLLDALNKFPLKTKHDIAILTFGSLPKGIKIPSMYSVVNLGSIANEKQLAMAYSVADVFVLPSLEDNLPNTLIEAMACGVPVIGYDIGGIADVIEHKKTGYLVKPKDIKGLIEGIDWVMSSADSGRDFLKECRAKAESKFSLEIQANAYREIYERIRTGGRNQKSEVSNRTSEIRDRKSELQGERAIGSPEKLYQTAQGFMDGGREQEAIGALKVFLALYPDYALAHNDLGFLYYKGDDKEKALRHYKQAVMFAPDNTTFQKNLADFYYVILGQVESALEHYAKALSSNPVDLNTLLMLGHISVSKRRFDEAAVFYNAVLKIEPSNRDAREKIDGLQKIRDRASGNSKIGSDVSLPSVVCRRDRIS